jgi:aminoglycoside 6'-N-acetyltransferase I
MSHPLTVVAASSATVTPCASAAQPGWLALRQALWPQDSPAEHLAEMSTFVSHPSKHAQFVAYSPAAAAVGFVEAAVRTDYVNGTQASPVAFVEGLYVIPAARRNGIAAHLVASVERWARSVGCKELAADASIENAISHLVHGALGFRETERVVFFCKSL